MRSGELDQLEVIALREVTGLYDAKTRYDL